MRQVCRLSIALALMVVAAVFCQPPAENVVDPYMGDWQGSVTVGGAAQTVAVTMIPEGDGKYEAKLFSEFNKRVPVLFDIRGVLADSQFSAVDNVPFEASRVLGATEKGVLVDAAWWTGKIEGGALQGAVSGNKKGTFKLSQTKRTSPTLGQKPPAGATVLFDGKNLDAWQPRNGRGQAPWKLVEPDVMEAKGGDIITKDQFRDFRLHLEFLLPYMPTARGQGRANSGVYVLGRYEIQVLDSYGLEGADNECGGIYTVARPAANMCFPPLQWQTYDITLRAPRLDAQGAKTENCRITVLHNGVTIHDNIELPRLTPGGTTDKEGESGPLLLQDHGNPVQYRNIWVEKLG